MPFSTLRCKQSVDSHSKQNCNFWINSPITLKMGKGHKNLVWIGYRQISTQTMIKIKCKSFPKAHRRLKRTYILIRQDSIYHTAVETLTAPGLPLTASYWSTPPPPPPNKQTQNLIVSRTYPQLFELVLQVCSRNDSPRLLRLGHINQFKKTVPL